MCRGMNMEIIYQNKDKIVIRFDEFRDLYIYQRHMEMHYMNGAIVESIKKFDYFDLEVMSDTLQMIMEPIMNQNKKLSKRNFELEAKLNKVKTQ